MYRGRGGSSVRGFGGGDGAGRGFGGRGAGGRGFGGRGAGRGGSAALRQLGLPESPLDHYGLIVQDDLEDVPYFNEPICLENQQQIVKIDEMFDNFRDYYMPLKRSLLSAGANRGVVRGRGGPRGGRGSGGSFARCGRGFNRGGAGVNRGRGGALTRGAGGRGRGFRGGK